jgi:hypothetical protein
VFFRHLVQLPYSLRVLAVTAALDDALVFDREGVCVGEPFFASCGGPRVEDGGGGFAFDNGAQSAAEGAGVEEARC